MTCAKMGIKITKTSATVPTIFCTVMLVYALSILEVYMPITPAMGRSAEKKAERDIALGDWAFFLIFRKIPFCTPKTTIPI